MRDENKKIERACSSIINAINEYPKGTNYDLYTDDVYALLTVADRSVIDALATAYKYGFVRGTRYQKKQDSK